MVKLLDGVEVLELGTLITAPLAGMMLADLGANVLKIERPEGGDPFRNFRGGRYSPHFTAYNRGKRSMQLDLRTHKGREILLKLIATADVLLENFRPDVMARMELSRETLAAANPRLIHCSITGFGPTGPYSDRPCVDLVALALSGVASLFLDPDNPRVSGPTIADNVTGMYACYGILGALYEREQSGKGRYIEVNMLESAIAFIPDPFANETLIGLPNDPFTRVAMSQSYAVRCADGKLLAIQLSFAERFWEGLLAAIERPELAQDVRFATRQGRFTNYHGLVAELAVVFRTKPAAFWLSRLEAHDVPTAPIHTVREALDDPQVRHLGTFYEREHPTQGKVTGINRPIWIDGDRDVDALAPPTLGEHTSEVLGKLGYSDEEVTALREAAVV
jgi:formyl-CoA transferase